MKRALLILLTCAACCCAQSTTIRDTVYEPVGQLANGWVRVTPGNINISIYNGALSAVLNFGTYTASYTFLDGTQKTETWCVGVSNVPVTIAQMSCVTPLVIATLGGDIVGTALDATVIGLQGRSLSSSAPSNGYTLVWNNGSLQWQPGQLSATAGLTGTLQAAQMPALTGDVTNSAGSLATLVGRLNGTSLAGLSTGLLKNTTGTGVPSIALLSDLTALTGTGATAQGNFGLGTASLISSTAGGDLSGTLPSPTVVKLNGTSLAGLSTGLLKNTTGTGVPSIALLSDLTALTGTGATAQGNFGLGTASLISSTAGGDLSGTLPSPTVVKLNGTSLAGLATGLLKNTTSTGVPSIAADGTDYVSPTSLNNATLPASFTSVAAVGGVTAGGAVTGAAGLYTSGTANGCAHLSNPSMISASTRGAGGSSYSIGDTFTVNGGAVLASGTVLTLSGSAVATYSLSGWGNSYTVANGVATTATSGSGSGLTINITGVTSYDVPVCAPPTGFNQAWNLGLAGDLSGWPWSATVGKLNGTSLAGLSTGLLKNTTSTGVPSIALLADITALTGTGATAQGNFGLGTASLISSTAGGDLSGTLPSPTVVKLNGTSLAGLATGLLKNTTSTGVPSIALLADITALTGTGAPAQGNFGLGTASLISSTAGGDLSGTLPSPTVVKLNGTSLAGLATGLLKNTTSTGVPSIALLADITALTGTGATAQGNFGLGTASLISSTAGGDLSGTLPSPTVVKLNGTSLAGLATGLLKNTTSTGVPSIAADGTDYVSPTSLDNATLPASVTSVAATANVTAGGTVTGAGGLYVTGAGGGAVHLSNPNMISASTLGVGGSGFSIGDTFTVNGGTVLASGTVLTLSGSAVATYILNKWGNGYAVASGVATTATTGSGSGLTLNITTVTSYDVPLNAPDTGFNQGWNLGLYGDLSGFPWSATVDGIQGRTVSSTAPTGSGAVGQVYVWNQGTSAWVPETLPFISGVLANTQMPALTGDVSNTGLGVTVGGLNGTSLGGLATGILKNTTSTGVPSIAALSDVTGLGSSGSGNLCLVTNCAMTTPNLGTPSAVTLTNGTNLPMTGTTGTLPASRMPAPQAVASGGMPGGVAAITAPVSINTPQTAVVTYAIPANTIAAGTTYRIIVAGTGTSSAANANSLKVLYASSAIATMSLTGATSGTNIPFRAEFLITFTSTTAAWVTGTYQQNGTTGIHTAAQLLLSPANPTAMTTTSTANFELDYAAAASTTTATFDIAFIDLVKP